MLRHVLQPSTQGLSFVVVACDDVAAARTAAEKIARACRLAPHLVDVAPGAQDERRLFKAMLAVASEMAS